MKTWKLALLTSTALALLAPCSTFAVVGYYNRPMQPGFNLIADQLINSPNNSINLTLVGTTPDGAMFTKWTGSAYLPLSIFDADAQSWSIDYNLDLGEGAVLWTPLSFTATFVGEVGPYLGEFGGGPWLPNYSTGMHLVSDPIPRAGNLSTMFNNVVGRPPEAGESVWILNESTQLYSHSMFNGFNWDVDAALAVGQAAWFDIGGTGLTPPVVPEPSTLSLLALSALGLLFRRERGQLSISKTNRLRKQVLK